MFQEKLRARKNKQGFGIPVSKQDTFVSRGLDFNGISAAEVLPNKCSNWSIKETSCSTTPNELPTCWIFPTTSTIDLRVSCDIWSPLQEAALGFVDETCADPAVHSGPSLSGGSNECIVSSDPPREGNNATIGSRSNIAAATADHDNGHYVATTGSINHLQEVTGTFGITE
ncbi:hypothetical protein BDN72DRAFT_877686 [Pluteus cervinus]|uniref:Uncharacterized protein n=1 Tax=Pluteus cervinus TaxID=181527 RepID=A0ACD3AYN7_9AGAR|nr:hypothetical protein BDN72DRAFT_877686 [Pluteus cervinus]